MDAVRERTDTVPLAASEPRCEPAECTVTRRCSRAMASVPRGTPMTDYSKEPCGGTVLCPGFISIEATHRFNNPRKKPEPKPWPTGEDVL